MENRFIVEEIAIREGGAAADQQVEEMRLLEPQIEEEIKDGTCLEKQNRFEETNEEEVAEIHDIDPAIGQQQLKFLMLHSILKSLEHGRQTYLDKAPLKQNALENPHSDIFHAAIYPLRAPKFVSQAV